MPQGREGAAAARNMPALRDRCPACCVPVPEDGSRHPHPPSDADQAGPVDSITPHRQSRAPTSDDQRLRASGRPGGFFPDVLGIRTGDPVFGPSPSHSQLGQRVTDGLSAGYAHRGTHLGCQIECPNTRVRKEHRHLQCSTPTPSCEEGTRIFLLCFATTIFRIDNCHYLCCRKVLCCNKVLR